MTNQDLLIQTVLQGKCAVSAYGDKLIKEEKAGEDITCCTKKLTLMVLWIDVLERYNCQMYGTATEGKFQCLTEEQAMVLVGKLQQLISA